MIQELPHEMDGRITETVNWRLPDDVEIPGRDGSPASHVWKSSIDTLKAQPGFLQAWYGIQHESETDEPEGRPRRFHLLVDWDQYAAHERFMKSPIYAAFLQQLKQLIEGDSLDMRHVPFTDQSDAIRAFQAPITEVLTLFVESSAAAEFPAKMSSLQETVGAAMGVSGVASGSAREEIKHENFGPGRTGSAFMLVAGWDLVDAHMAFRQTSAFKEKVHLIRGSEVKASKMRHVAFSEV